MLPQAACTLANQWLLALWASVFCVVCIGLGALVATWPLLTLAPSRIRPPRKLLVAPSSKLPAPSRPLVIGRGYDEASGALRSYEDLPGFRISHGFIRIIPRLVGGGWWSLLSAPGSHTVATRMVERPVAHERQVNSAGARAANHSEAAGPAEFVCG